MTTLARSCAKGVARHAAYRFCKMAQQSGLSENFNAVTGAGLQDLAYTWKSGVHLIFAHQLWASGNQVSR
jgi:putative isomerase